jgi:hypothetical protein
VAGRIWGQVRRYSNDKENPYQGTEEVDENEETHGEKTESTKLGKENQLAQVMDG